MSQASLFKGLSAIFGKYDSELISRLLKKFEELQIEDYENIQASLFCKAIFFMQEDQKELKKSLFPTSRKVRQVETSDLKETKSHFDMGDSLSPKKASLKNKELKEDLDAEKFALLGNKNTMAKAALREQNEYSKMYQIETRDPTKINQLDRVDLIRGKHT